MKTTGRELYMTRIGYDSSKQGMYLYSVNRLLAIGIETLVEEELAPKVKALDPNDNGSPFRCAACGKSSTDHICRAHNIGLYLCEDCYKEVQ